MLFDTAVILKMVTLMLIALIGINLLIEYLKERKIRKEYKRRVTYIRSFKDYK